MLGREGRRPLDLPRFVRAGALALVLLGCESHVMAFQPVNASHTAGFAHPAIRYDLQVGPSALGRATLWSEGASEEEAGREFFDVELEIYNATKSPIRFDVDNSRITTTTRERRRANLGGSATRSGSDTIAPYSIGRIGLRFKLPRNLTASDIGEFELAWRLESPAGDYEQSTRFAPVDPLPTNPDEHLVTCVGANGFEDSDDCKDARMLIDYPLTAHPMPATRP